MSDWTMCKQLNEKVIWSKRYVSGSDFVFIVTWRLLWIIVHEINGDCTSDENSHPEQVELQLCQTRNVTSVSYIPIKTTHSVFRIMRNKCKSWVQIKKLTFRPIVEYREEVDDDGGSIEKREEFEARLQWTFLWWQKKYA